MNPAQGQAQQLPSQGQAGSAGQQQPRPPPMYMPNQIRSLPLLTEEEKNKYEQGLQGLWKKANNPQATSADQLAARQKIIEFSKMLIGKIQARRQHAQQQTQQGQPPRPPSAQQNPSQSLGAPATQTQPQKAQQSQPTNTPLQGQAPPPPPPSGAPHSQNPQATTAAALAAASAATATATTAAQRKISISESIMQHVNKMVFRAPAHLTNKSAADISNWAEEMKEKYARALATMESTKSKVAAMEKMVKDRAAAGKPLQDEEHRQYTLRRDQQLKFYNEAHKWVESVRKQQEGIQAGAGTGQNGASGTAAATQQPNSAPVVANPAQSTAQAASQNVTASVNAAVEAARNQQQLAAANRQAPANGTSTQTPHQTQPRPVPQSLQQTQVQSQVKTEQPHPPPVNTAQVHAVAQAARIQTSQSGTPVTAGGPTRALSHSAAMTLANQRASSTPGSVPIQEKATAVPQGVTLGGGISAGRPTMSQGTGTLGGVMNQPPIARIPAYSHDAEGDHVLNKKKLDELVRQVCGGSGDSQDGHLLTPEVEESVLNMADSFVDNVLHAACRNAKERGSKVLEIRDIQLVLERTYNIRVPGYSSDELRTVRKVQPSPGWIAKMSAVQAAKVMPGKGDP
ncbi:uncharacterized protein UV8b_07442 [Ustilaginoidea virens]|uniref:Transcription initiation factor TFIID subunit 12 domain-containing protein n=1 Tax=Ustilaginoidea virens TaxID=1159556 RepID=A0A8E5HX90_USTVR|nr:uncharacterized protein UV8b_07442 [Ustilaginoidea virens]QUC23201.1 hypothetical protein UV8b_07442 [Ustilaginoidea virens]